MNNTRKKQIKTITIVLIAIIGLAIGFGAFSSSLLIKTRISVNPNSGTFNVKFSNSSNRLDESQVVPTKSTDIFTAYNGVIDNSGIPTIANLGGEFTQPGETITYDFYTINMGDTKAYLTDVIFNNVDGESVNKKCTSTDGTNQTQVDEACKSISIKLIMGTDKITGTRSIVGHELNPSESEPVRVVIEYSSGAVLPEVEFDVEIGSISLIYNTLEGGTTPQPTQSSVVWQERGLTSSNVVYDKAYKYSYEDSSSGTQEEILGIFSNGGSYFDDHFYPKEDIDSGITYKMVKVGLDYIIIIGEDDSYENNYYCDLIVFDSSTTVSYYQSSCDLNATKESIISNSDNPDIYTLTNESLSDIETSESGSGSESESESGSSESCPSKTLSFSTCTLSNNTGSSGISQGDKITCGTESFYVIEDPSNSTVKMLAEYNLNTDGNYQDDCNTKYLQFWNSSGSYGYWTDGTNDSLNSNFTACTGNNCYENGGIQYPVNVYGISNSTTGETSNLTTYVNSYVNSLNSALGTSATGRLITYDELINLGCSGYNADYWSCTSAPSWVYQTTYWSSSTRNYSNVWYVDSSGRFDNLSFVNFLGLRPVIEISQSAIQTS